MVLRANFASTRGTLWFGATYTIFEVDDGTVVATGPLDRTSWKYSRGTYNICLHEAPACYAINVTKGEYPERTRWILGETLSGDAPFSGDFFLSADGNLSKGCPTTSPPSRTPVPTSSLTRTYFETASCLDENCEVLVTFDIPAALVDSLDSALLTIDLAAAFNEPYKVAAIKINGAYAGTCGNHLEKISCGLPSRCSNFDERDVAAAARSGSLTLSFSIDFLFATRCIGYPGWSYFMKIEATLVIKLSETKFPTHPPTISSAPSVTLVPTMTTLTTFVDLQSSLAEATIQVVVEGVILFETRLDLVSKNQSIVGLNHAALDGGLATVLFSLTDTTLSFEDMTIRHGRSTTSNGGLDGGCVRAQRSTLVLVRVVVANCACETSGGAFGLWDNSFLRASQSTFYSNVARAGGAA